MKEINLLDNVFEIKKKHEKIAELTGENYNVFEILGLNSSELMHSKFISNLLNVNGKHGQKDKFLKLFINQTLNLSNETGFDEENIKILNSFNTQNSFVVIEKYIGEIDIEESKGGRIDIIISDGENYLIIENKIYAIDQNIQLERYNNFKKNRVTPIYYLSLDGKEASILSTNNQKIKINKHYIAISYKKFIVNWLGLCIKEIYDRPLIRETLIQYQNLIKKLTNHSTNIIMSLEIAQLIKKSKENLDSLIELQKAIPELRRIILEEKIENLLKIAESKKFEFTNNLLRPSWKGFSFTNRELEQLNIKISFAFASEKEMSNFIYGVTFNNNKERKLTEFHENLFNKLDMIFDSPLKKLNEEKYSNWIHCFSFENYSNWENLSTLKKIQFENFENDILKKIEEIDIVIQSIIE